MPTKKTSLNPKLYKAVERLILKGWTQEALARNKGDNPVDPLHKDACCFCVSGAIMKIADERKVSYGPYLVFLGNLVREIDNLWTLARYNDQNEIGDIKRLLRKAARKVARKP